MIKYFFIDISFLKLPARNIQERGYLSLLHKIDSAFVGALLGTPIVNYD